MKTKLENLKKLIEDTQENSESSQDKWVKILKNRNGANNKTCKLISYPDRFLFKDAKAPEENKKYFE